MSQYDPTESTREMLKKVVEVMGKRPSMHYMQKAEQAETMLEASVFKNFANRFNTVQENAILAVQFLENDRADLARKAAEAEIPEQAKFFERAVELYERELLMIYKGEV